MLDGPEEDQAEALSEIEWNRHGFKSSSIVQAGQADSCSAGSSGSWPTQKDVKIAKGQEPSHPGHMCRP